MLVGRHGLGLLDGLGHDRFGLFDGLGHDGRRFLLPLSQLLCHFGELGARIFYSVVDERRGVGSMLLDDKKQSFKFIDLGQ